VTNSIAPNGSQFATVPNGRSIAVFCDGQAQVWRTDGFANSPALPRLLGTVNGSQSTFGPFASGATIRIDAVGGVVTYYEIGNTPQAYQPAAYAPVPSSATLNAIAIAGELKLDTTYVDTTTGQKFWARDANNYSSAGLNFDVSALNYVESGLLLPASGTIALTLTATRDNYVDLRRDGTVTVTAVTVGAAAPAIPVNSMRLGFCTTNASNVTSRTISAFDSLGNWMYNVTPRQGCELESTTLQGVGGSAVTVLFPNADIFDNASMHDNVTNSDRIILPVNGIYQADLAIQFSGPFTPLSVFILQARVDGTVQPGFPRGVLGAFSTLTMGCSGSFRARAGQYLDFLFSPNGIGASIAEARLTVNRIS